MIKLKKLNEDGLTGGVGSYDAGDTGIGYSTLGAVPGMGTIQYPTRDAVGSGDVPTPAKKKKKKKKKKLHEMKYLKELDNYGIAPIPTKEITEEPIKEIGGDNGVIEAPKPTMEIEEDLGTGKETFDTELTTPEIDVWNEPAEWESLSASHSKINWEVDFEVAKYGIGGVNIKVNKIYLLGEIDKGEEYQDWELTIENIEVEIGKNEALIPLYPTNVEVDFNRSSNKNDWKIKVTFGTHGQS